MNYLKSLPTPNDEELEKLEPLNLLAIYIGENKLSDIPEWIFKYTPKLFSLDISNNQLKKLPDTICLCKKLNRLHANGNQLDEKIVKLLQPLNNLKSLYVSDNLLDEDAIKELEIKTKECIGKNEKVDPRVGEAEMIGVRPTFEDALMVSTEINQNKNQHLFGIFDGHGGSDAAQMAAELIPKHFASQLQQLSQENKTEEDIKQLIKKVFNDVDKAILEKMESLKRMREGCTASIVFVDSTTIYCANIGDSRVILCSENEAKQLSLDHRPSNRDEHKRIRYTLTI